MWNRLVVPPLTAPMITKSGRTRPSPTGPRSTPRSSCFPRATVRYPTGGRRRSIQESTAVRVRRIDPVAHFRAVAKVSLETFRDDARGGLLHHVPVIRVLPGHGAGEHPLGGQAVPTHGHVLVHLLAGEHDHLARIPMGVIGTLRRSVDLQEEVLAQLLRKRPPVLHRAACPPLAREPQRPRDEPTRFARRAAQLADHQARSLPAALLLRRLRRRGCLASQDGWLPNQPQRLIQAGLGPLNTASNSTVSPAACQSLGDLERDDGAKAVAPESPRAARVDLAHLAQVMAGHLLDGLEGRAAAVEAPGLKAVERLVRAQIARQRCEVEDGARPPWTQNIGGCVPAGWIGTSEVQRGASAPCSSSSASALDRRGPEDRPQRELRPQLVLDGREQPGRRRSR